MPSQDEHPNGPSTTVEDGRARVCGALVISVNRSWQVDVEPGNRPVAAFKAMAPIAFWSATDSVGEGGDVYLAAVAAHDAFWLGFEADEGSSFAVIIDLDGSNALTGRHRRSDALEHEPDNFILVPDQPWFDSIAGSDGTFEQLIPRFDIEADPADLVLGAEIRLVIYPIEEEAIEAPLKLEPEGPKPLYSKESAAFQSQAHPWPRRSLRRGFQPQQPCAHLAFHIVEPQQFESITGTRLPPGTFDDADTEPPPPFDPFQAP